jgi:tetratricopeptide (TPR) repeat protein
VREVAYDGLPFATRRRLHRIVAERLEADPEAATEQAAWLSVHLLHAGAFDRAWRYARLAADRAGREYAYADAVALYRRALEAARHLAVPPEDISATWEAIGDANSHNGDQEGAKAAFTQARRAAGDDPLRDAHLLHRQARVEFERGNVKQAVRWTMRGLRRIEDADSRQATAVRANLTATLATIRWRAGRLQEAAALCRQAITEAEAVGDDRALAQASYVLDTALTYDGEVVSGEHFRRALEIYERLEDLDRQAAVLNNMGIAAYWAGRWSDAVDLYRRGAVASDAAGDAGNAAFGEGNIGEVLSDQGRIEEAEQALRRARRIFRGTGHDWNVAYVDALLGRAALRRGDAAEACRLLDDAIAGFSALGVVGDAAWAQALRAEAALYVGEAPDALRRADRLLLEQAGTGRLAPLLHRVRGLALAQQGRRAAAEGALGASMAEARLQHDDYEVALTLDALIALQSSAGARADGGQVKERDAILQRLDVRWTSLPPLARVPAATGTRGT